MKTKWLFPHRFRLIGWFILIPSVILLVAALYEEVQWSFLSLSIVADTLPSTKLYVNFTDELADIGVIVGLLLLAFSREKTEDEMISQLRLEALQWSVYANYLILAILIITVHGRMFLYILVYNMFTVLLVFVARFRWLIHQNNKVLSL